MYGVLGDVRNFGHCNEGVLDRNFCRMITMLVLRCPAHFPEAVPELYLLGDVRLSIRILKTQQQSSVHRNDIVYPI